MSTPVGGPGHGEPTPGLPPAARARVVTVSDRSAAGEREDRSGPELVRGLRALGFGTDDVVVVPDDAEAVVDVLEAAVAAGVDLVLTTGGTGLGPRDVTPEATLRVVDREAPGLAEAVRAASRDTVPTSILSRGVAGVRGRTLVVNLPGSPGGARDGLAALADVLGHAVSQLQGGDHG